MNSNNDQDWERRFQELEVEVNPEPQVQDDLSPKMNNLLSQIKDWYNRLPNPGKVAVAVGGVLLAFSVLNSILKLVASLLTIAILGVVLYGVYKFLMKPPTEE